MKLDEIQNSLPADVARFVSGYAWRENHIGFSRTRVFRLTARGRAPLYLKIDPHATKFSLAEEKRRLDWLKNRLPVPETILLAADETNSYLLMTEISGVPAIDDALRSDVPRLIEKLVEGLKLIHAVSIENCPFRARLVDKIEAARERMENGLVEEEDFDEERLGRTAADVFEEMLASVPAVEETVFTHGDFCAPNVIIKNKKLSGFVDWAEAGVADKYQDLALLSRSVRDNFGAVYEEKVFDVYGIEPDREKIYFYRLLDEFF
jgi:aminoglycoside phosphotransferase